MKHSVLKKYYNLEKTIGTGGFAKVKLATHLATGEKVAVKIISKEIVKHEIRRVSMEINAMKTLCHNNICQLYQVLETDTHFYLVTEFCAGGELFDHIVNRDHLDEVTARTFFKQIISAVSYLHLRGFAHRDIKPENILLDKNGITKLIDFGLCAQPGNKMLMTSCGSPTYAAPELIRGSRYEGAVADIWSLGVVLYAIVVGALPFEDDNFENLYSKIQSGKYLEPPWLSPECCRLIRGLLEVNPKKRFTISDICKSDWLSENGAPVELPNVIKGNIQPQLECLELLSQYRGLSPQELWCKLNQASYDYDTATYLILCRNYENKQPLKINALENRNRIEEMFCPSRKLNDLDSPVQLCPELMDCDEDFEALEDLIRLQDVPLGSPNQKIYMDAHKLKYDYKNRQIIKPSNLVLTPNLARLQLPMDNSPSPLKVTPRKITPIKTNERRASSGSAQENRRPLVTPSTPGTPSPRKQVASTLLRGVSKTAPRRQSARRVLGSIERSLHRVRHALTPRRRRRMLLVQKQLLGEHRPLAPQLLTTKDLSNVSTTTALDPELVFLKLRTALHDRGILCKQKGYTLRGRMDYKNQLDLSAAEAVDGKVASGSRQQNPKQPEGPQKSGKNSNSFCTFELEVCLLKLGTSASNARVVVRRKRLKGDAWCYKKVCEEVLRVTSTDFSADEDFLGVTRLPRTESTPALSTQ